MTTFNTITELLIDLENSVVSYDEKITALKKVEITKKKNGEEFSMLSNRCVVNAKIYDKAYAMQDGEKELHICYLSKHGYQVYEIDCCGYCDELPDTDERSKTVSKNRFLRAKYLLTPEEMRERISANIQANERYKQRDLDTIKWIKGNQAKIQKDIETIKQHLEPLATLNSSIKYRIAEVVENSIKW